MARAWPRKKPLRPIPSTIPNSRLREIRGIARDYEEYGDDLWEFFHQKSRAKQSWYYYRLECALDYGDARTGVAVSDPSGMIVGFTTVISEWNREKAAEKVAALVQEKKPERLVMGFPKNMDGTEGPRADLYREQEACGAGGAGPH